MRTAEFIQRCIAAGMSLEVALTAAKAFDIECAKAVDEALEDVRAKARERQARSRASRDKAGVSRDKQPAENVTDVTSPAEMSRDKRDPLVRVEDNLLRFSKLAKTDDDENASAGDQDDWPKGDAHDHAAELVQLVGSARLDPNRQLGLVTTMGRLVEWRRAGASWAFDVVPTIKTLAAKARQPIGSWKFFDNSVAQSMADNRRALEIPEASQSRGQGPPSYLEQQTAIKDQARRLALATETPDGLPN